MFRCKGAGFRARVVQEVRCWATAGHTDDDDDDDDVHKTWRVVKGRDLARNRRLRKRMCVCVCVVVCLFVC